MEVGGVTVTPTYHGVYHVVSETKGNTFWDIKGSALQTTTNQVINHVTVMTHSNTPVILQMSCDNHVITM